MRGRRRPQLPLDFRPRRRDGKLAKRPGPKRPRSRQDPPHRVRPAVIPRHPVHVVLRTTREVGNLRTRRAYRAFRGALARCADKGDYRVVHISIQANHVHLLVEADDKHALTLGMQGLAISAAKRLNRELRRRRGEVFPFRYHATPIDTPTQARNALAYVLNNWRRHREDRMPGWRVDPYSSGVAFPGWTGREHLPGFAWPRGYEPLPVCFPHTWLLARGWRRAGPPVELAAIPRART